MTGNVVDLLDGRWAIEGNLVEIDAHLHAAKARGWAIADMTRLTPTGVPGRYLVEVRLRPYVVAREPVQAVQRKVRTRRWKVAVGLAVTALALFLTAAVWAVVAVLSSYGAWVLAALGIAGLVLVMRGRGGGTFSGTFTGRFH